MKVEQIGCNLWVRLGGKTRRWIKRQLSKMRRRAEKRDPQNAPRQNREFFRGWVD